MRLASIHGCAGLPTARQRAALAVLLAVLLAHGLGFGLIGHTPGPGWQTDAMRPLQVRRIALPPVLLAPTAAALAPPQAPAGPPQQPRQAAVAKAVARAAAPRAAVPAVVAPAPQPSPQATEQATKQAAPAATAATLAPGGLPVPVYATQLPTPQTLHYSLRRGPLDGTAELRWQAAAGSYQLALSGDVQRRRVIAWASTGSIDANGIAPDRYAESRRGRELRAANFQREAGRITFSGPQVEHALLPGAQDRLSWLLQLPAVLAANPALAAPGALVDMLVADSRGDAQVWRFAVVAVETVALPGGGSVSGVLHLRRDAQRPYDTQADVWLDPARQHLPVRLHWRQRGGADGTELLLLAEPPQPPLQQP